MANNVPARLGFPGVAFIVGLCIFAVQQGCAMLNVQPSWIAGVVWFLIASGAILIGIWFSHSEKFTLRWPGRLFLSVVAIAIVAGLGFSPIQRQYQAEHPPIANTAKLPVPRSPSEEPSIVPPPSFDNSAALPDGRIIISSSPEDLQAALDTSTIEQFNRRLGGKWIKMSVRVRDVWSGARIYAAQTSPATNPFSAAIVLYFHRSWVERLSLLERGSIVTVRCKLTGARPGRIQLEECELL